MWLGREEGGEGEDVCVGGGEGGRVGGWEGGGGRRKEGGEKQGEGIEPQNSHKQSLLSGMDQEHLLPGTPMLDLGRGI